MVQSLTVDNIVKYGKANGYSPKQIQSVINGTKNDLVTHGINSGYKGSQINNVLNNLGYSNYNPLTAKANWENLLPNIAKGAREIARDMRTIGGVVAQPFVDVQTAQPGDKLAKAKESFINAINNDTLRRTALGAGTGALVGSKVGLLGTVGGTITGGLIGLLGGKGFANTLLQPYETSTKDIGQAIQGNKSWGDIATDILQGGMRNPLYSGLDVLSLGGAKALGGAGRAIGNIVPADAPIAIQQIIQSPAMREFSRNATNAFQASKARNAEYLEPLERLGSTLGIDNAELAKNIILNEGNLTGKNLELAKDIKKSIRGLEAKVTEYGFLDKDLGRSNVVAQYGMQKLMPVIPDLLHRDLVKYIESGELTPRIAEATLKNPDLKTFLDNVIDEGKKLYDNNDIAFLSQAKIGTVDPRGEIIASATAKQGRGYFGTNREIGRATIEDYSKVLEDSLAHQQAQSIRAVEAIDVMEDLLNQPGLVETIKDINNIPKGKTVINKSLFRKKLADAVQEGSNIDVADILNKSNIPEVGAYLIPNVYFTALDNMFRPVYKGSAKDVMSAFKKTVLANPHWFALNRIGNWTNNSMGGVTPIDNLDAVRNMKIMPKQLKAQTSFNNYVGDSALGPASTVTTPIKNIAKELKRFSESNKSLGDLGRIASQLVSNTSNIFSNPMFRLEAAAESVDRYANFIRQAKMEAKATKQNWKDIVRKADKDTALYNKLNTQVNKDLGDYVGRNYLMDNTVYEALSAAVPFYRFLSQTGRTSFHQLANHGMAFQSTVMNPARAGRQFSEDIIQRYQLDPETYEGGVPYARTDNPKTMRYMGTEPLPFAAVASDLLSPTQPLSLLSPQISMIPKILEYKKGEGWLPTSEGLTQYKRATGKTKGYEPTTGERLGYGASQIAGTFYAPARMIPGWMRELYNTALGRPTLSMYDANMFKADPLSYARELPAETIGKWFGLQNRSYAPRYIERPKRPTRSEAQRMGMYNRQYERNTKKGK